MRTLPALLIACICVVCPAWLLPRTVQAAERHAVLSLNGEWEFVAVKPMLDLVPDRYVRPDFPTLSPEWREVINPEDGVFWDETFSAVEVPQAWENFTQPGYNEAGWYLRHVDVPEEWSEGMVGQAGALAPTNRLWLEFDAVATAAGVWADGEFVGGHVGDYTRWRVELTDVLRQKHERAVRSGGEGYDAMNPNTLLLAVYVDELPGHITQGFLSMIAPHHGGIWQDVRMYATGPLAIEPDGLQVEADCTSGVVTATVSFDGEWDESWAAPGFYVQPLSDHGPGVAELLISHYEDSFTWSVDPLKHELTLSMTIPTPRRWSPVSPLLYRATVELPDVYISNLDWPPSDRMSTTFGFREIKISGCELLLNGEVIYLRSALNWGCYPGVYGPLPSPEQVREEFSYIQSLGFNAETVCLVNMPDYFYDIADEMGVFIWQEYPTWHNTFSTEHLPTYRREFPAFLRRDRNHPSIIMRSISVEAGVQDQEVMGELVELTRQMTDTPVQDNNSWFWLSNEELTDWYGEDNYLNNDQWARHLLSKLPAQLNELPAKPYIIGESILCNTWVDVDSLSSSLAADPAPAPNVSNSTIPDWQPPTSLPKYLGGHSDYPWWFPSCYESCAEINAKLRAKYNTSLPECTDIVCDYLMPQSFRFNLAMRRFQIKLLHADPRYTGYTVNVVRDMPLIRAGLIDDLGNPRWSPEEWSWHGDHTTSPVQAGEEDWNALRKWEHPQAEVNGRDTSVLVMSDGYSDLSDLFANWEDVRYFEDREISPLLSSILPTAERKVLVTSVLTDNVLWHLETGGAVVLLTSKWPGALGSHHHYFWRDSVFVPPLGPWAVAGEGSPRLPSTPDTLIDLLQYDLIEHKSQVIPVDALDITDKVDPLIRLYDTHDLSQAITYDMAFATRVGGGLLIASSLDHSTDAGQGVLDLLADWAEAWSCDPQPDFPQASLSPDEMRALTVAHATRIIPLDEGWRFALDPEMTGEAAGYMRPEYNDLDWDSVRTGVSWEALGYNVDGMGWYRLPLKVPTGWVDGKVRLIAEGIDDAYTVWINGEVVQTHGSFTVHEETVWQQQTVTDLTEHLVPGLNTIALQVVDITGQGGIFKPLYLAVE